MRSAKSVKDFGRNPEIANHVGVAAKAAELTLDEILPNRPLRLGQVMRAIIGGRGKSGDGFDHLPLGLAERGGALGHDLVIEHGRPALGTHRADQLEGVL